MPRRELLTEPQRLAFTESATYERGMVRHYTVSTEDLALIDRRRGDPNRLGVAVLLCYLRFPRRTSKIKCTPGRAGATAGLDRGLGQPRRPLNALSVRRFEAILCAHSRASGDMEYRGQQGCSVCRSGRILKQ
jgi:hypothetical protein